MKQESRPLNGKFYIGISGLQLPIPKSKYPEEHKESSRLTYYSTFFNSIEINSTFYKLPMPRTVVKWADLVPDDFQFTFKLWKEITHVKNLEFKEEDVFLFFKTISGSSLKKGCVLIQFPPSIGKSNFLQLESLLRCIKEIRESAGWKIAVEFRNKSWYYEEVYELIEKYNAGIVIQDIPKSTTPSLEHRSNFIYIRFHGPTGNYRDSYSDSFLYEYATYIKEWMNDGKKVFVYFNNTMGDAFKNALTLKRFLSEI